MNARGRTILDVCFADSWLPKIFWTARSRMEHVSERAIYTCRACRAHASKSKLQRSHWPTLGLCWWICLGCCILLPFKCCILLGVWGTILSLGECSVVARVRERQSHTCQRHFSGNKNTTNQQSDGGRKEQSIRIIPEDWLPITNDDSWSINKRNKFRSRRKISDFVALLQHCSGTKHTL